MPPPTDPGSVAVELRASARQDPVVRPFTVRWGRSLGASRWIDAGAADRTDRQVSQLISLGGVALILGEAAFMVAHAVEFTPLWNTLATILLVQVLVFAAFGWALPISGLRVGWVVAPMLGAVLSLSAYAAYTGPLPASAPPWPWAFEAALVSYLVLVLRPGWATACTVVSALLPMLSAALFLGEIPQVVLTETPIHLANVIYIALFTGIRARLNRLRDAEAHALTAETQRVRAQVSARDKEDLARLIHDEVLSVLVAAARFRGTPPPSLRANASRALALFQQPAVGPDPEVLETGLAADRLATSLRRIDAGAGIACTWSPGEIPTRAVETVGAAAAEGLRNSVRHATAAELTVEISVSPDHLGVLIEDRGPGFDIDQLHDGQLGIRDSILGRMRGLPGGQASVESTPGKGTRVLVTWQI